ncbi:uncharacterized protein ova [Prorops nasuta]|uniref:uncharacterized protein ova n=1 Tax=Prorops nasuta TaxID=863751 RepID=UPI0034CDB512
MRFTHAENEKYGISLIQDQAPNHLNKSMMATPDDAEPLIDNTSEEGSMVSNLPLLFANGCPTSLEKITMAQLECFINFMVQCSLGQNLNSSISQPQWWPKEVKFSNPLVRPNKVNDSWMGNLKKLVFRCYTYHRSEYLLRFCSYLSRYPRNELEYVNNWDSTTSLYHKLTGKLLVTFRNENLNYDKKYDNVRKSLLGHSGASLNNTNKLKMQHPIMMVHPPSDDIYLCDNCDAEFIGLEKMKEHERVCCGFENTSNNSRPATPDTLIYEPELQQNQFLEYFQLFTSKTDCNQAKNDCINAPNTTEPPVRASTRIRGALNLNRCPIIPFSSPAGLLLLKKSKIMTEEIQQERLDRVERHICAPPIDKSSRPKWLDKEIEKNKWAITYKPNQSKPDEYVHQYKFRNSFRNKPMLSIPSQFLYIICRPVFVLLRELTNEQIEELKRDPSKYHRPARKATNIRPGPASSKLRNYLRLSQKRKLSMQDETTKESKTSSQELHTDTGEKEMSQKQKQNIFSEKSITLINLCSSDEDDDLEHFASSDENRDPSNIREIELRKSFLKKIVPKKCFIYPTESNGDWLKESILDERDGCANKRLSSMVLSAHLSPILRPAP